MANLETLELTITASAERAEQGVNILIRSLSNLSEALIRPYSDLKDLNDELRTLARLGKMKLSLFDGAGRSATKARDAAREAVKAAKEMERVQERIEENIPAPTVHPRVIENKPYSGTHYVFNPKNKEYERQIREEHAAQVQAAAAERRARHDAAWSGFNTAQEGAAKLRESAEQATRSLRPLDQELKQKKRDGEQARHGFDNAERGARNLGEAANDTGRRMNGLQNVLSRVGRIAQTMLIRTALKSLLKGITEVWQGAYSFSKKMGGEFAKSIDRAQASLKTMAASVVRLLGPAMQAIAPVIKVVATAVSFLSDAIANLLKALGLTSELFGTSSEELAYYASSAGKATKGILAGFDELNVVQSKSGSGSGSGGGSPLSDFVGEINNQLALLKVIIGESMLGIGLILMCSGHPAYGLALMVLGASSIASALTADWEKLPKDVKGTITGIMTVVAGASLALGAIIALSSPTHLGIGIALMAIGAANLAAVAAVNWNDMSNNVDKQISQIATIVGGALLALGAVIAFACPTHLGLGVALMAAGAASLATAAAVSWGDASGNVKNQITVIAGIVGGAALAIGALLTFAGPGTQGIGIALMVAGAASIATAAALSWSDATGKVKGEVTTILGIVGGAALVVGAILTFSGANIPLGIGLMAAGGASLATAVALNWDSITTKIKGVFTEATDWLTKQWDKVKTSVSGAWEAVKEWWSNNISKPVEAAWKATVKYLTEKWDQIKGSVETAWAAVGNWWTDVKSKISKVWDKIKDYVTGVWSSISTGVSDAWSAVGNWWKDVKGKFSKVWESAKDYVTGVWGEIGAKVTSAWNVVASWFGSIKEKLETAWEKAKKYITDVWTEIGKNVTSAWNSVVSWFGSIKARMETVWEDAKNYITGVWDSIKKGVTDAWDNLKKWWENIKVKLSSVWEDAKTYITGVWDNIGTSVSSAWDSVAKWFGNIGSSLRAKWEEAKGYITGVWGNIKDSVSNAWKSVKNWWTTGVKANLEKKWKSAKKYIEGVWDSITKKVGGAWDSIKLWWANNISSKFFQAWVGAKDTVVRLWDDIKTGIGNAWDAIKQWWDQTTSGPIEMIKSAWLSVSSWFQTYVTQPIGQFFKDAVNVIIDAVNWMIDKLNSIGHIKFDGFKLLEIGSFKIEIPGVDLRMWQIPKIGRIAAEGAYGINSGELFIANEAGPELVGTMDGKTTVANQEQIVEGIRRGVYDAQSEQNALLRRQNELLTAILRKDASVRIGASSMLGRTVRQSLDMYEAAAGV